MRVLAALRSPGEIADPVESGLFLAPPAGSIERRWAIYRNAYTVRLAEAIESDYPAVARITGAHVFAELCHRFLTACPPYSYDIGRAGERLPDYLQSDPLATDLPFLSDLARLELALVQAMVSPDHEPLRWGEVEAMPAERFAETPQSLAPATILLDSPWPLAALWLAKDQPDHAVDIPLAGHPSVILVTRQALEPRWRSIDADERAIVRGAQEGVSPASLLQRGVFGHAADASLRLVRALQRVVSYGAFRSLRHSGAADGAPLSKEVP
ncbi:MAG TPA: DNA-binding domain-containing protein [Candidatus Polarisedimenticolaceae bacterium]|nr:DNA-binding domain-containing protein [Candidatus Polarisedimenticolaceae bacterium]